MKKTVSIIIGLIVAAALLVPSAAVAAEGSAVVAAVHSEATLVTARGAGSDVTTVRLLPGGEGAGDDGYNLLATDRFSARPGQSQFVLSHPDVSVTSVRVLVDGVPLGREDYVVEASAGRLLLTGVRMAEGAEVTVTYRYGTASRPASAFSWDGQLKLNFVSDDGNGEEGAPQVSGGSMQWNESPQFTVSLGYITSTPAAKREGSYMREQFARAIAPMRGSAATLTLPSQIEKGRALAFGTAFQGNGLSVKSHYWALESNFELPTESAAQENLRAMLTAQGADRDLKKDIGMEHLANSVEVRLAGFNWSGQQSRDENWQPGHKEYGLTRNVWQHSLSGALGHSRTVGFSQVTTRLANDAATPERSKNTVETLSLQQNYRVQGLTGSLSWQQQKTYNSNETTGAHSTSETEIYSWSGSLLRNFAIAGKTTVSTADGQARKIERVLDTQGSGIRLNDAMALTGHYEETEVEGQGSQSKLVLGLPRFAVNSRVALEGAYVAEQGTSDQTTRDTTVKTVVQPAPGLSAEMQLHGREIEGQPYWREGTLSVSKGLGRSTTLSAALARQEQGEGKINASKQITLQHSSRWLDTNTIYQEFSQAGDGGLVHPRLITTTTIKAILGVSFTHFMVHRDDNELGGVLTREWQASTRLFKRFDVSGAYVANPVKKREGEYKVKDNTRTQTWTVGGPIFSKFTMSLNWQLVKNADPNGWQQSRSVGLAAPLSAGAKVNLTYSQGNSAQTWQRGTLLTLTSDMGARGSLELICGLHHQPGSEGVVGQQGLLLNYEKVIDDNHSLRFSATDQPGQFALFGENKNCLLALAPDAKWSMEFKTAF